MSASKFDARRKRLAEAVIDVIGREGADAATVRRIAAEFGLSTGVVSHYFSDKQDMLLRAYKTFDDYAIRLYEETIARDPTDLVGYLMAISAFHEGGLIRFRAFVAVWERSLTDRAFGAELNSWTDQAITCIKALIRARNPDFQDQQLAARRFLALVQGLSVQILLDPHAWSGDELRSLLAKDVEQVLGPGHAAGRQIPGSSGLRPDTVADASHERA
jgi:AcrR family transcriptional regulator